MEGRNEKTGVSQKQGMRQPNSPIMALLSIVYLTYIYRISIVYLSCIYRISIVYLSYIYRISIVFNLKIVRKLSKKFVYLKKKQYLCSVNPQTPSSTMFIIGIAGGTGSGKTTVVRKLIERLPKGEVTVIPLDSYYNDSSDVPAEERQKINFDHPNAFEWTLLEQHLRELKAGKAVEQPIYDYITSSRQKETVHVEPSEIIIVEGILTLHNPDLREQMDLCVFVDADADDRLIRVIRRDIVERGRTVDAVIERYQRVLKPMHEQFIEPCKRYAHVIIPQGGHNNAAINMMAKFIKQQLKDN